MKEVSTPGVRTRKTPRQQVYYKGYQYDLHPVPGKSTWSSCFHGENCFLWILFLFLLGVLTFWVVAGAVGLYPDHYHSHHPIIIQSTENSEQEDGPFVFKLNSFAAKRQKRTQCVAGEVWDSDVSMCAPRIKLPTPYDSALIDGTVAPCNSFYQHMCGRWIAQHTNEDRTFSYGYHRNQKILESIVKDADVNTDPIGKMYASCKHVDNPASVTEAHLEFKHIEESIIGGLRGYGDLPVAFAKLARQGYTAPFAFAIERHPLEPRVVPFLAWDGVAEVNFATVSNAFQGTRAITMNAGATLLNKIDRAWKVLQMLQRHPPSQRPQDVHDYVAYLETNFTQRDLVPYHQLPMWHTPHPDPTGWRRFFQAYGGFGLRFPREQTFWILGKSYMHWLLTKAVPRVEVMDWRAYVEFCILYNMHSFTPSLPDNVYFKQWDRQGPVGPNARLYHRIPRANTTHRPFHTRDCVEITRHMVPGLLAKAYLERFPEKEEVRHEVREMLLRVIETYKQSVQRTTWLPEPDRQTALEKIDAIEVRVAEPDEWHVEPFAAALHADRWEHNMNLIRRYRVQRNLELWHRDFPNRLDRNALAFFSSPLSGINAYYSGPTNTITVLSGILQRPFYDHRFSPASKYAIVGGVLAHELGHALDPNGIHWDHEGTYILDSIYSAEAKRLLGEQLKGVIREFGHVPKMNNCTVTDLQYATHTLGEDTADLNIMSAYKAYFDNHKGAPRSEKQRFFMAFAQTWCASYDSQTTCRILKRDVHALPQQRVDSTLAQFPGFQEAFSCTKDMSMYRSANDQVAVYG